jgi:conjugal transfer pilus assembly protein TraD
MSPRPGHAALLALLGGTASLGLALAPPTPWTPPEHQPLTLALLVGWTLWRLAVLDRLRAARRAWQQSAPWQLDGADLPRAVAPWLPVTLRRWLHRHGGMPHRGVFLGRAFRWNAQDTQILETALATDGALPVAADARGGHPALHAVGQGREHPLVLPWSELAGHVLITGTTRSGKTRLLEILAAEVIRGPGAVVILDPKGDRDLLARCAAEAHRQGRPFACLSPAFPAQSARLNVLDTAGTPAEVAARIRALMPSGGARQGDPFFEEYPLALLERLATVQAALGQRWTLEGLYAPAVLRHHLEALLAAYLRQRLQGGEGQRLEALIAAYTRQGAGDLVADALIDDLQKPRDHFTKVTSNLIPAFRGVVGPPLGPLFSTVPGDLSWTRIVDRSQVVYVALASLLLGDVANRIGRVLLQDLVGYLGRRYAYDDATTAPPITVLIDEFGDVAFPLFTNALNKGGGANARFMLAQQSLADAEAAMGPAQARRVLDNLNTKIWCRLADDRTAAEATEGLGLCTVRLPDNGVGLSYGGLGGLTGSVQRRFTAREVPLVRPAWLTALPRGEALVRMKGEVWKLRVPLLTPPAPAVLRTMGLEALLATLPAPGSPPPPGTAG